MILRYVRCWGSAERSYVVTRCLLDWWCKCRLRGFFQRCLRRFLYFRLQDLFGLQFWWIKVIRKTFGRNRCLWSSKKLARSVIFVPESSFITEITCEILDVECPPCTFPTTGDRTMTTTSLCVHLQLCMRNRTVDVSREKEGEPALGLHRSSPPPPFKLFWQEEVVS